MLRYLSQYTRHHLSKRPRIDASAFQAPQTVIIGNVEIKEQASIWYQCVLRGDIEQISIGPESNVQDGTVIHVLHNLWLYL